MTNTLHVTPQTIGLAAAGAAALGLSLSEGLLQPLGTIERLAAERQRSASAAPTPEHRAALPHVAAPSAAVAPAQPSPKFTRAERRAARAAELERQRAVYAAPLTPATEPHSMRVEGYDPEFTPNPENFGQLS